MRKIEYGLFHGAELIGTWGSLARAQAWADANNRMYARNGHAEKWTARRLTRAETTV